jgi:ribonuclease G
MGGIIVVDFIDLHKSENRKQLYEKLKEEMKNDRAKHKILPPSRFGLVEITRQRVRPALKIETREESPEGNGTTIEAPISILQRINDQLGFIVKQERIRQVFLHVHPFVAAYINQGWLNNLRRQWSKQHKVKIRVIPRDSFTLMEYHFYNDKDVKYEF